MDVLQASQKQLVQPLCLELLTTFARCQKPAAKFVEEERASFCSVTVVFAQQTAWQACFRRPRRRWNWLDTMCACS